VFGDRTTGGQNDLLRATDMARSMVTEYGMSDVLGPVNHDNRRRNTFLETGFPMERGVYAEETARLIDAEVKRIIDAAEAVARKILTERRHTLDLVSERLLEKEVIEGEELIALMGQPSPEPDDAAQAAAGSSSSLG